MAGRLRHAVRAYPDTPAGRLRQCRDAWAANLASYGHSLRWRRSGTPSYGSWDAYYQGKCRRCGFEMRAGRGWHEFRLRPRTFLARLLVRSFWVQDTAVPKCTGRR